MNNKNNQQALIEPVTQHAPITQQQYNLQLWLRTNFLRHDFCVAAENEIIAQLFQFKCNAHFTPLPDNNPYNYVMNSNIPSFINAIFDPVTEEAMTYRKLIKNTKTKSIWDKLFANELGHLANGVGEKIQTRTNTIFFILYDKMPSV